MTNAKNTAKKIDAKVVETKVADAVADKVLTIADVARELKLDPKRARAFMRKNVALYTMRKQKFTKASQLYKDAFAALKQYADKNKPVTA